MSRTTEILGELKRRKVVGAVLIYVTVAWVAIEMITVLVPLFDGPDWLVRPAVVMVLLGLPVGVVGALTLLVAGIGVANVMYVVARERTREIGLKRSLGARRWHITAQFVFEALLITLLGGGIGLALAAGIVLGVDSLPDGNEAMQFLANPKLSWPIGLGTVGILVLIGLVAGAFPARRAARLDPVEALRYE